MKRSHKFFLIGTSLLFFWILDGFDPHLSWQARFFKIALVGTFATSAWILKNSSKANRRKTGLIVLFLLAFGTAFAEPYVSHWLFDHSHFHYRISICSN